MNTGHEMNDAGTVTPSRGALWGVAALVVMAGTTLSYGQASAGASERLAELEELAAEFEEGQPADAEWTESDEAALEGDVLVDDNELVELHVRDEDLRTVLQMLSIQSQRSIVPTQNVSGTVTANLYGKSFSEALDAILLYNGFGYIEQGGTIFVMPIEEVRAIEAETQAPVARVIRLNYMNATDAAAFAQVLLSENGSITTNGATEEFSLANDAPAGRDEYANDSVLLVYDYEPRVNAIESVLAELDTRPEQVLIETTILQTAINEANAFGVDFSIIADLEFVDFTPVGGPLRVVDSLIAGGGSGGSSGDGGTGGDGGDGGTGSTTVPDSLSDGSGFGVGSTVGQTAQPGGFKVGVINDDISVFVRMLDEVGDTTIISNPKILTLNRQEARVQVGRRVGYLSTTTTDTSTSQTVEFLDTGTQLYVRPFLAANDDTIRMELRPEVSQPLIRTVTDATGAAVTVPDEDTSHLITNVIVRDGQTIVLGGLFTERTTAARRQVPIAGDLPFIGAAFRGHDDSIDRSEIVFMVTPTKVNDEVLLAQGEEATAHVEYLRAGSREGLLPWSREKRSSQLLIEAERLNARGDTKGALNKTRRALQLSPVNVDAIRLRESLLSEPTVWPSRSMLEQIVHDEASIRAQMLARTAELEQQLADGEQPVEVTEPTFVDQAGGNEFANAETDGSFEDSQFDNQFDGDQFEGDQFDGNQDENQFEGDQFENDSFDGGAFDANRFNRSDLSGYEQGGQQSGSTGSTDASNFTGDAMDHSQFGNGSQPGSPSGFQGEWPESDGFDNGWEASDASETRVFDTPVNAWEVDWSGVGEQASSTSPDGGWVDELGSENDAQDLSYGNAFANVFDHSWRIFSQFARTPVNFGEGGPVLTNVDESFDENR